MGYMINMGGKKLTVAVAVVVVAMIAAGKGSMAMTPPAVSDKCVYDLVNCAFNDPSSHCCDVLNKAYHNDHACLCTNIIGNDEAIRTYYLGNFAACGTSVPSNLCLPGENSGNSDKTAAQKTTLIAVSTMLGFLLF